MTGIAACALIFSSCSKNEVDLGAIPSHNSDAISFTSTTTRASVNNLTSMTNDATGFVVYGKSGGSSTDWYTGINGTNNYKYTTAKSSWGWSGTAPAPAWPTTAEGYPVNFYAYYPATHASYGTVSNTHPALAIPITIQSAAGDQVDLLAAKNSTATKPGDGNLPLTFNHILSKINFAIIAGTGTSVYVQSIVVKNVHSTATYNYVEGSWGPSGSPASYDYYNSTTKPKATFIPTTADEETVNPIYLAGHSNHLMLMPQINTPTWNKSETVANAYIEVVYRIASSENPNNVGYTDAINHPANTKEPIVEGPLFVKVGFPMAADSFTWDPAKGYTYNIKLGTIDTSGGNYIEDNYIDENGDLTELPIDSNIGDPVAKGEISFTVTVTNWVDQTPSDIK